MFGYAESEDPRLTNREIISEEFQPMWSQSSNVTDGWTDRQTDDMWSHDRVYVCLLQNNNNALERTKHFHLPCIYGLSSHVVTGHQPNSK